MAKETGKVFSADQIGLLRRSLGYLALALDVYDTKKTAQFPAGWKEVASVNQQGLLGVLGVSGFYARIYENAGTVAAGEPRYVVAFRGTDSIRDKKNLDADVQIFFGRVPNQYKQALAFVQEFCETNNVKADDMALTGHSLGGYLAITVGMTLGIEKMWAFNSPGPTRRVRDQLSNAIPGVSKPPCKGLVQVRSDQDVISRWQYPEGRIIEVKTPGVYHKLLNLQQGVIAAINGTLVIEPVTKAKRSVGSVFNSLSRRLSESAKVGRFINGVHGGKNAKRPPDCACA